MKRLDQLILDRIDDESLELLRVNYPSLKIKVDEEWKRRLLSCDRELFLPLLDFLYTHNVEKSTTLKQGLYGMRTCFPWKIGAVYDFRTGQVKKLEIKLGWVNRTYSVEGNPILFSWLDANENKMLLREFVSNNTNSSLFSTKLDRTKTEEVRDFLLDNKFLNVDVIIMQARNKAFRSFPKDHPLSGGEDFVVSPYRIYNKNKSILFSEVPLPQNSGEVVSFSNIPIIFSQEVKKYLDVISQ